MITPVQRIGWLTDRDGLRQLLDSIRALGYALRGPVVENGGLIFGPISGLDDLPTGWVDDQSPGSYRLTHTDSPSLFGVLHGSGSAKAHFFPPQTPIWRAKRSGTSIRLEPSEPDAPKTAMIGLRPCDLHAIAVQDRVFRDTEFPDPTYCARRANTLLVAVNCTRAHSTCFCTSMGGGPRAGLGFDIALTEFVDDEPRYLLEAGSEIGRSIVDHLPFPAASESDFDEAERLCGIAEATMTHGLDTDGLRDLLYRNAENPRWQSVAERCFACTSCTQVCPTCFCHTPVESSSLDGTESERTRVWDSCFTEDFSYIHGGSVRRSIASRYRQWLTHKLAAWQDQFGTTGCVGCGRCITWCPSGIDLRDEAEAIRRTNLVKT